MKKHTLSRRTLLNGTVHLAVIGSVPALLQGCKKAELSCEDATGLSEEDAALRSSLEYRDRSPHGETKNCESCAFYAAGNKDECGGCTLVKGPIHPQGYCNSWAAKN